MRQPAQAETGRSVPSHEGIESPANPDISATHAIAPPLTKGFRIRAFASRHWGKALVITALLVLVVLYGPRWALGPLVPLETVVQRDFIQTVVASGRVETPHRVELGVQIAGVVLRVPVVEGQTVAAGTPLIELEASELRATAAQAAQAVQQGQARMRQLREVQSPVAEQTLRAAQANLETAQRALARSQALRSQGFIGQAALDETQRAERVAHSQVASAQQQLASARPSGSDNALAQANLAQAEAAADAALARLRYALIRAPLAGTLILRNVEPGTAVQPGKVLMVLSPAGPTQVVVQIDERNLRLLRLGQSALASADAYPGERFTAELAYINPGVDAGRGAVEVKLRVPEPPTYLRQDMTVSVDIEVARRQQAVLVPTSSLHDAETAAPWVLKLDGRHVRRQFVQLGLRSNGVTEVIKGLHAGDRVVPAAAKTVVDGVRIRAAAR
ncbi:MAG: efflux RND transporter periplasmic adaptor subunit [Rhodoferax sp.]|nr:efflux RND transporter periplasmic adaptor subunit [Rhodoferax sp.]